MIEKVTVTDYKYSFQSSLKKASEKAIENPTQVHYKYFGEGQPKQCYTVSKMLAKMGWCREYKT